MVVLLLFVVSSVIVYCWFCYCSSLILLLFIVGSIIICHHLSSVHPSYHPPCKQRLTAVGKGGMGSVQCAIWGRSVVSLKNE
jgi:hypothetical protein